MSVEAQVAVLTPGARAREQWRMGTAEQADRPLVALAAFAALGLYGVLRWETLMSPAPIGRLLGLLILALAVAAFGGRIATRSNLVAAALVPLALLLVFPLSGLPLSWTFGFRIAVTANAISGGLSALPQVLLPYLGINDSVRVVMLLGAGILLLDAGVMFAFAPRGLGDLRRAAIALPLVALAVVPATLVHPRLPYVQGLVLFALLAAFMWGDRLQSRELPAALGVLALCAVSAVIAAPALDAHHPWFNYQALAGSFSPTHVERFDWEQRYGPLNWPRTGHEVLDVQAAQPDYWKAEDLELFDGIGFSQAGNGQATVPLPEPSAASLARWTQSLKVTVRAMSTGDVIAAGDAAQPQHVAEGVVPGVSPGTWVAAAPLGPGDSYTVAAYTPHPAPEQLQSAGGAYPVPLLLQDLSIVLPDSSSSQPQTEVLFPIFHSNQPLQSVTGVTSQQGSGTIERSPYARAFALARRLASQATTPYGFATAVEHYLSHGYVYDENPPQSAYPLETFLFKSRRGYCQQFAGAMALLLRMGGIPARVATGFATGTYDSVTRQYVVTDIDAHSWVEVWFPQYGWVRFDPTPAAAPARGGTGFLPALLGRGAGARPKVVHHETAAATPAGAAGRPGSHGGGAPIALIAGLTALLLAALALGRFALRPRLLTEEELLSELDRALARCGRPLADEVTLAALEHRFRSSPDAASYVRAIRLGRFAGAAARPTLAQRRALRAELRAGLGMGGRLRALWALPPRVQV